MNLKEQKAEKSNRKEKEKITRRETQEEMTMTEKEPKKESARTAPTTGNKLKQPATTFAIKVASMFLILYSSIKYTIKFESHPPVASDKQPKHPVHFININ